MALKLKGSTSGFVAIDAPSVAGNNTLILPENTGSAHQILANDITAGVTTFTQITVSRNGDLTVPGTISIGGTLTYEDVTNVDSVGIVTARQGVHIDDSIVHIGDTNTKIRFPAADTITAETGGSERLRIKSDGVVGINTVGARGATLEIQDIGSTGPCLLLAGATDSEGDLAIPDGQDFNIGHWNNVDTFTERFHITSAGKIGIRTDNPTAQLQVYRATQFGNNPIIQARSNNGSTNELKFEIDGDGDAYLNGNVGIKTDNPASDLHILDTIPRIILEDSDSGRYLTRWWQSGNATVFDIDSEDTGGSPYFMFKSGGTELVRITDSGLVGIGTNSPENDLHIMDGSATMKLTSTGSATSARLIIESEADSYGGVHFGDPSDEDAGRIRYYHGGSSPNHMQFSTNATEHMRIHSGGVVSFNSGIELGSGLDATAANTLDDYEEGTWTPVIGDNSGNTSSFGSVTSATYTKIGNTVRLSLRAVNMNLTGLTSSDPIYITGLPFNTVGYSYGVAWARTFLNGNWGADQCMVFAYFESNKAFFQGDNGATGGITLTVNDLSHNNSDLFFTVVYTTNS